MKLAELAIKRPVFITSIVLLMLVLGFLSLKRMSVDLFPDVTFPSIFVQTIYPGASPQDIEKLVSKPLEDELGSLTGLDKIYSQNSESLSNVILLFKIGSDVKDLEQQIRQRIGNIKRKLPLDIKEPIIRRFDPADQPIAQLSVSSEIPQDQLFDVADQIIKSQFETIPGVGLVNILGGRKKEIQVMVNKSKLQDYNLSLIQIIDKIGKTSSDVPVGKLKNESTETIVRAAGEFLTVNELKEVAVNFLGSDQTVKLKEIADVKEGLVEEETKFSFRSKQNSYKSESGLALNIYKQSGSNTVKIVDLVQAKLNKVNKLLKERGIAASIQLIRENARPIRLNIADVTESILLGILLCIVVVFFFLGSAKSTFITGMALPNSLLGGFIIMAACGFTINILTLLALSLAVGLLIDDAIVVRENIFRHIEMGETPKNASIKGTSEVALAVIATTMVVIAVFGPISFLDGVIGQFFKQFGLTVVFTMLISLFDAFTVAPMLSTFLASKAVAHHERGKGPVDRMLNYFDNFQNKLEDKFVLTTKWVLTHRKTILGLTFGFFFLSLLLISKIPKNFLPAGDNGEFRVTLELPVGTSLEKTKTFVQTIEQELSQFSSVDFISSTAGFITRPEANKANVYVRLVPRKQRDYSTSEIKSQVRELFRKYNTQAVIGVSDVDIGGGGEKIFQLSLKGENLDELSSFVEKLKPQIEKIKGLVDVDTNYRTGSKEFLISFDRSRSEKLGISTVTVGAELRARTEGQVAAIYRKDGNEYDIRVRLRPEDREIKSQFDTTLVPNMNFNMIPLQKVATLKTVSTYSQINRLNKGRYILIDGNIGPDGNLGAISQEVDKLLQTNPELKLPPGITYEYVGQAEDFIILIQNMVLAMGLGVLLIYLVLGSLYESFITPITILLALPFGMTGAFAGLFITGKSLDMFSMIGMIMLMGVVAKNSILLVDYANQLIQDGVDRNEALLRAAKVSLRPILMTSFALIAGTIPIAIGLNEASAQRTSMGVSIIGGLITSTLLTLIVVPAAFGYIDDFRLFLNRLISKLQN